MNLEPTDQQQGSLTITAKSQLLMRDTENLSVVFNFDFFYLNSANSMNPIQNGKITNAFFAVDLCR